MALNNSTIVPLLQPTAPPTMSLADWTHSMKRSVLREMLAVVARPGILSFAGGLPAPELFPTADYAEAVAHVLATDPGALQYGPPYAPLKAHVVELMARRGVTCREEQIFLTTGAQQGLNIAARLFLNPGGQVILEELVYTGIQQVVAPYRPQILTVPTNLDEGMDVDAVEAHLLAGTRPAFIYAIPEAHNPLGVSISPERQARLAELARRYQVPLVEDDPYGFLCYDGTVGPPMRALDDDWVIYVGSFSKLLAPALRLGWMVAPEALLPKLTVVKEAYDLETSAFVQRTVSAYLDAGYLPGHLAMLCREYGMRRDAMLAALYRYFPAEARWTRPASGMFVWVELPAGFNTAELLHTAVEREKVAFIPGQAFNALAAAGQPDGHSVASRCMRLNFSNCTPELIEEGIARLGALLQ
ncbi:MAG: PLP-dependent aminotransferase family protein [Chloroflexi bacterium]|nr:PLP-dependent aminotransferase family protein [Chloroflexota bacterium]